MAVFMVTPHWTEVDSSLLSLPFASEPTVQSLKLETATACQREFRAPSLSVPAFATSLDESS
jgi:hypothetical protein